MRFMYFGTKRKMRWVKVHSRGSDYTASGSSERLDFRNGGVAIRESTNGHMEYTLTWNSMSYEEARAVADYAYGLYGAGSIHFVDPIAATQNVLNKAWSAPGLTAKDGVPIAGRRRPQLISNLDDSQGYPIDMARYDLTTVDERRSFYVPVPPGFVAWVGVHGDTASTLGITAAPTVKGVRAGASTLIPVAGVGTSQRFTHSFPAVGDQGGLELFIQDGEQGYITLAGLMVQILPAGATPAAGDFISGQGAAGCQFEGKVQPVPYTAAKQRVGLSVKLVETGDHL